MRPSSSAFLASNSASVMCALAWCSRCSSAIWSVADGPAARRRGGRPAPAWAVEPVAQLVEAAVLVGLHLGVDLVLHLVGAADVLEDLGAGLAGRLDLEVAQAEHALEDPLAEEDRVDALQRDLDAVLGDDALAVDDPVGGEHEVGADPADVALGQPDQRCRGSSSAGDDA